MQELVVPSQIKTHTLLAEEGSQVHDCYKATLQMYLSIKHCRNATVQVYLGIKQCRTHAVCSIRALTGLPNCWFGRQVSTHTFQHTQACLKESMLYKQAPAIAVK